MRKQPEDQWSNDAGGIAGVEVVGGSERNKREPGNQGKPMTNKPGEPGHSNLFLSRNPEKSCKSCPGFMI
jgi:hypothetical protein